MMRTHYCTLLLFSFCLLFTSCSKEAANLEELAMQGKYDELLLEAQSDFSNTYQKGSLYYVALAQQRLGRVSEAASSLELYLAMVGEQEASHAAKQLAVLVGNQAGNPDLVITMGISLEKQKLLDASSAKELYQALLNKGRMEEAHRIFTTYLKGTIDPNTYANVLIEAGSSFALIREALLSLPKEDAIQLLFETSTKELDVQRASDYFAFASIYEQQELAANEKKLLYTSLSRFASQAELRVQANKYLSLAQNI